MQPWLTDPRLARLLDYWQSRAPAPGRLPARSAIDPIELGPELLPHVALVQPEADGRLRFRLVGTQLNREAGADLTGRYIGELNPNRAYADYIAGLYMLAAETRRPVYSETSYSSSSGRQGLTRRLMCPLAADGHMVDMFIAIQVFTAGDGLGDPPTYTFASGFAAGPTLVVP